MLLLALPLAPIAMIYEGAIGGTISIEVNETARLAARFFLLPRSLETWKSNSG